MSKCNDGRCQTNRDGVDHLISVDTCYEKLYNIGKDSDRIFMGLSLMLLIIGAGLSAIMIAADEFDDLKNKHCIGHALYNNSTEKEYFDCMDMKISTITYQLLSLTSLVLSTILA